MGAIDWPAAYTALVGELDRHAAAARWTLCGLGACVDAMLSVHDAAPLLLDSEDASARALGRELERRAIAGIGGEIRVDWPPGPDWLDAALAPAVALGGTGPHAARVLSLLGAPALLALGHRDAAQLGVVDGAIFLADDGRPTPARNILPFGTERPKIYIFEFTAGRPLGRAAPPRSSRIIVRFSDPDIENDPEFERLSVDLAGQAGAGVLSGFNAIGGGDLDQALRRAATLARRWRAAGVPVVHLEMAGYDTIALRDRALAGLAGSYTSLGLSQSEYQALVPGGASETETIVEMAETLGIDRLCIHADTWAMAATTGDAEQERAALMMGCLLAATRAGLGYPARPTAVPAGAVFAPPPPERVAGRWSVVSCPAPYLAQPVTTLGLGDTFMAGCLLVLGQHPDAPGRPGVYVTAQTTQTQDT